MALTILPIVAIFSPGSLSYTPSRPHPCCRPSSRVLILRRVSSATARPTLSVKATVAGADALPPLDETATTRMLRPICLGVFAQMLGEGVAISTIPLHLARYGATPVQIGSATSAFSIAQMLCCPLVVRASGRFGRVRVLRVCLAGATVAGLVIALSSSTSGVILGRLLAGVFASSVPVSQAAVTEVFPPGRQSSQALAKLSAASQSGVVIGPALSAVLQGAFAALGLAAHLRVRAVFVASAAVALVVLALGGAGGGLPTSAAEHAQPGSIGASDGTAKAPRPRLSLPCRSQLLLRTIALSVGWSLTLSVSTYCLFSKSILGWEQAQISAMLSAGAAVTVAAQLLVVPRLLRRFNERFACAAGLLCVGAGMCGLARVSAMPLHAALYLLNRIGSGIADTSTAALVAEASSSRDERSHNLAMVQSTRAGARIVTPILSGALFERSIGALTAPGALPYQVGAALAIALAPAPILLLHARPAAAPPSAVV